MVASTRNRIDLLHPWAIWLFALSCVAWGVTWSVVDPHWDARWLRYSSRLCGYLAAAAIFMPYLHIARRFFLHRHLGDATYWMQLHVGGAYAGFLLALVHSRGHSNGWLTSTILVLLWLVMLSGVVGFYGRMLLYRILRAILQQIPATEHRGSSGHVDSDGNAVLLGREIGPELLAGHRERLEGEISALRTRLTDQPEVIEEFGKEAERDLKRPLALWRRSLAPSPLRLYPRAREVAVADQLKLIDTVKYLVDARQQIDLEYRFHWFAHAWLAIHGTAAWALLVLIVEHIVMSVWYGGY